MLHKPSKRLEAINDSYYLAHHGIKGMKWGVRRSREELGYKKSSNTKSSTSRSALNAKEGSVELAIMIGGVALTMIAPIATRVAINSALRKAAQKRDQNAMSQYANKEAISKLSDIPQIQGEHTVKQDAKAVNPNFKKSGNAWRHNCANCTHAYELRRRGYDAVAGPNTIGLSKKTSLEIYGKTDYDIKGSAIQVARELKTAWPDGARGAISVDWSRGGSHIFNIEKQNGAITFVDAQSGRVADQTFMAYAAYAGAFRTDDAKMNEKLVLDLVQINERKR